MYDVNVPLINVECCFICSFEGISKDRIYGVGNYWAHHAMPRPETRGGARHQTENETNQLICDHIKTFTCRASHYGRRGAPGCKYLQSDLSVAKMHWLFLEQNHAQVSYSLYNSVFLLPIQSRIRPSIN